VTAPALVTYDGVPVRHVFTPATSPRHVAALQAVADAEVAHRAACRESCERLSGERDPLLARPKRKR
jgi:hypothetical protein